MYVSLLHSLYSSVGALQSPDYAVCVFHSDSVLSVLPFLPITGVVCYLPQRAADAIHAWRFRLSFVFFSVERFALHVPHGYVDASFANRISDNRDYLLNFNDFTASL